MLPRAPAPPCAFVKLTGRSSKRTFDAPLKLIPLQMTRKLSRAVLRAAKRNGCKIHATILAAMHLAIARLIEMRRGRDEKEDDGRMAERSDSVEEEEEEVEVVEQEQ